MRIPKVMLFGMMPVTENSLKGGRNDITNDGKAPLGLWRMRKGMKLGVGSTLISAVGVMTLILIILDVNANTGLDVVTEHTDHVGIAKTQDLIILAKNVPNGIHLRPQKLGRSRIPGNGEMKRAHWHDCWPELLSPQTIDPPSGPVKVDMTNGTAHSQLQMLDSTGLKTMESKMAGKSRIKNNGGKSKAKKQNNGKKGKNPRSGITPKMSGFKEVKTSMKRTNGGVTITGQDYIRNVTFRDDPENLNFSGAVVGAHFLNPWRFPGSRLSQFANLYQKYVFKKAKIRYIPAVPATVAGQMIICFDTDPTYAPLGSSDGVIRSMMAHKNRKIFHVFDDISMDLPLAGRVPLFCDEKGQDLRLNNQAVFWIAMVAPTVTGTGEEWKAAVGSFVIEWEVEFMTQRIEKMQSETVGDQVTLDFERFDRGSWKYALFPTAGATPTTQAGIFIPQAVGNTFGLSRGVAYYYGKVTWTDPQGQTDRFFILFATLVGAQRLDPDDQIYLDESTGENANVIGKWTAVGPASGTRSGEPDNSASFSASVVGEANGLVYAAPVVTSNVFQAKEYLVSIDGGASNSTGSSSDNGAIPGVEPFPGGFQALGAQEPLVYGVVPTDSLLEYVKTQYPGVTRDMLLIAFGYPLGRAVGFISALVTATGLLVRVLTTVTTVVRMTLTVKREVVETVGQFLKKIDLFQPGLEGILYGTHYGHTLTITANPGPPPREEESGDKVKVASKGGIDEFVYVGADGTPRVGNRVHSTVDKIHKAMASAHLR